MNVVFGWVRAFFGWFWRLIVGSLFSISGALVSLGVASTILSYLTSILVVGWTYRWMQAIVLRGWWKQSRFRQEGSFEEFCAALGHDAPVARPRWFLQERIKAAMARPAPNGNAPGAFLLLFRALKAPWYALWLNFKIGFQALFCTYLLTGWGCLIMVFSWEFGWVNSFSKGYEQALIGPLSGLLGIALFIAAMFYVPMAQVHQAATGSPRAFFEIRFVWRLIQARLTAYIGLAAIVALASLPLAVLKILPAFANQIFPWLETASDAEVLNMLRRYLLVYGAVLLPTLLVTRLLAALIYRSAVLKVLARGWVKRSELHPALAAWLDRLELDIPPARVPRGVEKVARFSGRWVYRRLLYSVLILIWFGLIAQVYIGEFFNYHPIFGFINHPLIQFPCVDYIPVHLQHPG